VEQKASVARSPISDSLFLLNPVNTHRSVDPSKSHFPVSGRQLFQGIITSRKREEAVTLVKGRFIECKTERNDVNIISDSNLDERTTHIIFNETIFYAVKNAPNEHSGGIIILERKLEIHTLLENVKKAKALTDIYGMREESGNLDSVGGKFV
jgi:hypothetical protein